MKIRLKKHSFLLYCFALAALFLLIGSKSSPLYPMNDWVDVNCFFTMGKSLLAGKVPYVDLYEQKGPRSEERRVEKECRSRWSPYH